MRSEKCHVTQGKEEEVQGAGGFYMLTHAKVIGQEETSIEKMPP